MGIYSTLRATIVATGAFALCSCGGGGGSASPPVNPEYSIAYTVSGLANGQQLALQNNGANTQQVSANGSGSFSELVAAGGSYAVTVSTQPTGQSCVVSNGTGSGVSADVNNIEIVCSTNFYTVSGTVNGMNAGTQVALLNNGTNVAQVTSNTGFSFSTPLAYGSNFAVSVGVQPIGQTCTIANGTGASISANVSDVNVTCTMASVGVVHTFSGVDGQLPFAGLVQATDGNFYGTTLDGGTHSDGTVFAFNPVTSTLTSLYSFSGSDGQAPESTLVQGTDGNLYGTTSTGGSNGLGTIFMVNPATGSFSLLHSFAVAEGADPLCGLIQASDGNFYGTTSVDGANNYGSIFKYDPTTSTLTNVHSFSSADGTMPVSGLMQASDGKLYGTTYAGGVNGDGTLYSFDPTTSTFTVLHSFVGTDGSVSFGDLIQAKDGKLYGTTGQGGSVGYGVIFSYDIATSTFTVLHSFSGSDGHIPRAGLIQGSDGLFYGTTNVGGANGDGTLFKYDASTDTLTVLHSFNGTDGESPGPLVLGTDGNFYGEAELAGGSNDGVIYAY